MADMNERQATLLKHIPKVVAVVGCGGVGSWTAYFLALAGVPELWLFDKDTISANNLNRIPLPMSAVGKSKTEAVREMIHAVRPDCVVYAMGGFDRFIADNLGLAGITRWVIATTDTLASRQMVHQWAQDNGVKYIEAAAEGEFGSCTGEPADWSTAEEAMPGYQSVPVWVGPCVFSAGIAVAHVIHNTSIFDRAVRMGWEVDEDTELETFSMFDSSIEADSEEEYVTQPEK